MPHYGTLHDIAFQQDIDDIRGTALYGVNDHKLGKIQDVIFDHGSGEIKYVVVDTGGWFTQKKFLVPADRIHSYDKDKDAFQVDLTKEHIERKFPSYDENAAKSEKDWASYEAEYKRAWEEDPVLHRKDRIDLEVTPPDVQGETGATTPGGPGVPMGSMGEELQDIRERNQRTAEELAREDEGGRFTPHRLAGKFPEAAETANKIKMSPASLDDAGYDIGLENEFPIDANPPANPNQQSKAASAEIGQWHPRMRRFEEVLKEKLVDVTARCPNCAPAKDKEAA
jgi:sporulation protein YlmC with PRC-barrel domain